MLQYIKKSHFNDAEPRRGHTIGEQTLDTMSLRYEGSVANVYRTYHSYNL